MNKNISIHEVEELIDVHIADFEASVKRIYDNTINNLTCSAPSDFPLFEPACEEFFMYRKLEQRLEVRIRDHLVNGIFFGLFNLYGISFLVPDRKGVHYVDYGNSSIEDVFPFEFIIKDNNTRIGYRYTSSYANDRKLLLEYFKNRIDHVEIIDFSNRRINERDQYYSHSKWIRMKAVSVRAFMSTLFSEEIYDLYFSKVRDAINSANLLMGFHTIQILSSRKLFDFKAGVLSYIEAKDFSNQTYIRDDGSIMDIKEIAEADYFTVHRCFFSQGLYRALAGTADFSQCFITSEYLYSVIRNQHGFDYTSVVCGYLKSVEELLYIAYQSLFGENSSALLWDDFHNNKYNNNCPTKEHPYNTKWKLYQRRYNKNNRPEIGALIHLLRFNGNWNVTDDTKEIVYLALDDYRQSCRNEHFHKDNITDPQSVEIIRNNTYTIMFYLLGGMHWQQDTIENLKIVDDSYDRIYKAISSIPRGVSNFYLQFSGKEPVHAIRRYDQPTSQYDEYGFVTSEILFFQVDNFDVDYEKLMENDPQEQLIHISRHNTPERIWWYNKYKGKNEISW